MLTQTHLAEKIVHFYNEYTISVLSVSGKIVTLLCSCLKPPKVNMVSLAPNKVITTQV